jgi:hypothetical protein
VIRGSFSSTSSLSWNLEALEAMEAAREEELERGEVLVRVEEMEYGGEEKEERVELVRKD